MESSDPALGAVPGVGAVLLRSGLVLRNDLVVAAAEAVVAVEPAAGTVEARAEAEPEAEARAEAGTAEPRTVGLVEALQHLVGLLLRDAAVVDGLLQPCLQARAALRLQRLVERAGGDRGLERIGLGLGEAAGADQLVELRQQHGAAGLLLRGLDLLDGDAEGVGERLLVGLARRLDLGLPLGAQFVAILGGRRRRGVGRGGRSRLRARIRLGARGRSRWQRSGRCRRIRCPRRRRRAPARRPLRCPRRTPCRSRRASIRASSSRTSSSGFAGRDPGTPRVGGRP